MIVVDASSLVEVLLRGPDGARVEARLLDSGEIVLSVHLVDLEVTQVLRRFAASGELSEARTAEVLADYAELPMVRLPHEPLLDRIWKLRHNLTAYDAACVALAEMADATLVTRDAKLAAPVGVRAHVEVV